MKPDQHNEAVATIKSIICMTTPKASIRGKQDRNKLVKAVIKEVRAMTYDKRVKKG